jgi:hypothetical protein
MERVMTTPDHFPQRVYRTGSARVLSPDSTPAEDALAAAVAAPAAASWRWRRAALLLAIAAQVITIAAIEGADPIPVTWAALLLAIAPAPLAALAAFAPAPVARLAAPVTVAVLVAGIAGQVTHTGLFFVPALALMAVAAQRLWREKP